MESGGVLGSRYGWISSRILFGRESDNLRNARLGLIKWLMYSPRKTLRGKLPVRYQGLTLRFAVKLICSLFIFEQMFGLKIDENLAFLTLLPKRTDEMQ